jgi:hypothetical protein
MLESSTYNQVPSRYSKIDPMVSTHSVKNMSGVAGGKHLGARQDKRLTWHTLGLMWTWRSPAVTWPRPSLARVVPCVVLKRSQLPFELGLFLLPERRDPRMMHLVRPSASAGPEPSRFPSSYGVPPPPITSGSGGRPALMHHPTEPLGVSSGGRIIGSFHETKYEDKKERWFFLGRPEQQNHTLGRFPLHPEYNSD